MPAEGNSSPAPPNDVKYTEAGNLSAEEVGTVSYLLLGFAL